MKIIELNKTLSELFKTNIVLLELKDQTAKRWYEKSYTTPKNENFETGLIYGVYIDEMIQFDFSVKNIDNLFKSFYTNYINKYMTKRIDFTTGQYYTKEQAQNEIQKGFNTTRASKGIIYSTDYGIGIWVICMPAHWVKECKTAIENKLKELNINFDNEYSDAWWVYRYLINGNYIDHNKLIDSITI